MNSTTQLRRGHAIGAKSLIPAFLLALLLATTLAAQEDNPSTEPQEEGWGTTACSIAPDVQVETSLGTIKPSNVYTKAGYGTGGVALRNRRTGNVGISGVVAPAKAAFIYWAVITNGAPGKADKSIEVQRLYPTPASTVTTVAGTVIGTGSTPCWPGNTITVFRASIPLTLATGNGSYQVTLLSGAAATTNGADPWLTAADPLFEGASIVIVGAGSGTVAIYDTGLAGNTFISLPGLTYTLALPSAAPGTQTLFDNIGADGQFGSSRSAALGLADEVTTINSVHIAGPGSGYVDSDWNGSSGLPLPQLWDDTGHDITAATPKGKTSLSVSIESSTSSAPSYDCLTTVANVVEIR